MNEAAAQFEERTEALVKHNFDISWWAGAGARQEFSNRRRAVAQYLASVYACLVRPWFLYYVHFVLPTSIIISRNESRSKMSAPSSSPYGTLKFLQAMHKLLST